ncbi:MAG: AAA family ATPase [Saprospiraceae bacterium]|nr:AAA family ATPase [Saprospiraceae bacterium]
MNADIIAIQQQVLEYLLSLHFAKRAEGKEFYFLIEQENGPFLLTKDRFSVTFWQNRSFEDGTYNISLVFTAEESVFLNIQRQPNNQVLDRELWDFFKQFDSQHTGDKNPSFVLEINHESTTVSEKLRVFIEELIPAIQDIIDQHGLPQKDWESASIYYKTDAFFACPIRPDHFDDMLRRWFLESRFELTFYSPNPTLPQSLDSLEIWNYKGVKHTSIQNLPANAQWIFLTGLNGFGKTSILQSIALALFGSNEGNHNLIDDYEKPVILANYRSGQHLLQFYRSKYQPNGQKTKVLAYGPGRLINAQSPPPENRERLQEGSIRSLFDQEFGLFNVEYELITAYAYHPSYFKLLTNMFYALIPDLHEIRINLISTPYVEYIEKSQDKYTYRSVNIQQLATGFRSIIAFVGDMVLRLAAGNTNLSSLSGLRGIVIIDELELHLHPTYQKMLPGKLSELFPNVQFIASTHSPIPLLGAPKESVILKVTRDYENGIQVEQLNIDISVLQPNAILTSPIFGFRDIFADSHQAPDPIRAESDYQLLLENDLMLQSVNESLTPDRQEQLKNLFKK